MHTATAAVELNAGAAGPATQSIFVTVPEVTLPGGVVVPSFQVGQYLASKGADGLAAVSAEGAPWVKINYRDAVAAASAAGLALITELQYLAIAHDIANQGANWTGGAGGVGKLKQGLREGSVDEAQPGAYIPEDADEDRWFVLSNGARICDVAGNAYSWVFDNVQGDEHGLVAEAFSSDSPSSATAPFPSMTSGMGWRPGAGMNRSGHALLRGGCWSDGGFAGVFNLGCTHPGGDLDHVGFRCTK